jgi:hypothetical protein
MNDRPRESDWKRYSKMIADVRERYLEQRNQEIVRILTDSEKTPTKCFWDAWAKIGEVARILEDCLDNHSRSKMFPNMFLMLRHGMLTKEDLSGFSEALRDKLLMVIKL